MAGNGIGVSQPTHAGNKSNSNVKPNFRAKSASLARTFSDEDDSAERAAILQSPVKGMMRLSSEVSRIFTWMWSDSVILDLGYCQG
jgi:hypothetical protein